MADRSLNGRPLRDRRSEEVKGLKNGQKKTRGAWLSLGVQPWLSFKCPSRCKPHDAVAAGCDQIGQSAEALQPDPASYPPSWTQHATTLP
jgi:hypothetical protein